MFHGAWLCNSLLSDGSLEACQLAGSVCVQLKTVGSGLVQCGRRDTPPPTRLPFPSLPGFPDILRLNLGNTRRPFFFLSSPHARLFLICLTFFSFTFCCLCVCVGRGGGCVCVCVCARARVGAYVCVCVPVCVSVCVRVCVPVCLCVLVRVLRVRYGTASVCAWCLCVCVMA